MARLATISIQPSELAKVTLPLYLCWLSFGFRRRKRSSGGTPSSRSRSASARPSSWWSLTWGRRSSWRPLAGRRCFCSECRSASIGMAAAAVVPLGLGMVALKPYQLLGVSRASFRRGTTSRTPLSGEAVADDAGSGRRERSRAGARIAEAELPPEANTDFVFAVVGEELRARRDSLGRRHLVRDPGRRPSGTERAGRPRTRFVAAAVVLLQLVAQAAINIAVVTAMLPPKGGIAHPLLAAGGSSLVGSRAGGRRVSVDVAGRDCGRPGPPRSPDTSFGGACPGGPVALGALPLGEDQPLAGVRDVDHPVAS